MTGIAMDGSPGKLARVLAAIIGALGVAHLVYIALDRALGFSAKGLLQIFDLTQERSVGTWLTSGLLVAGAFAAVLLSRSDRMAPNGRRGWLAIAAVFALLSLDEVAGIHESTASLLGDSIDRLPAFLRFGWMIPALAAVALIVAWQWRFVANLPQSIRRRLVFAGALFIVAAAGFEMIESAIFTAQETLRLSLSYLLVAGVEETLEMVAAAFALLSLFRYLGERAPSWTLEFLDSGARLTPDHHGDPVEHPHGVAVFDEVSPEPTAGGHARAA